MLPDEPVDLRALDMAELFDRYDQLAEDFKSAKLEIKARLANTARMKGKKAPRVVPRPGKRTEWL